MTGKLSLEDRQDIQDLLSRYCHRWDAGDGEGWAALFTADGVCEVPGVRLEGTEQLKGMPAMGAQAGGGKFRHQITNILAEPAGDGADFCAYGLMTDWREGGKLMMLATYSGALARNGGNWKIATLKAEPA